MASPGNPFYQDPQSLDTSPGGGGASINTPAVGAPKIVDQTYSAGNPFAKDAASWQQGVATVRHAKVIAQVKAADEAANAPTSLGDTIKGTVKQLPNAAWQIFSNLLTHPVNSALSIGGGLLDSGPTVLNTLSSVSHGIANYITGGKAGDLISLPLPGQTLNEYFGNDSDVSQALQAGSRQYASYELGGAFAKTLGLGSTVVDAAGNTIVNSTLASRVVGNVVGGQLITDPNATLGDRVKQAAFDAAFGAAETIGSKLIGNLKATSAAATLAKEIVAEAKNTVMSNAISAFEAPDSPAFKPEVGTKLRGFLNSKVFDNTKNIMDFETALQEHLGNDFDDPAVRTALQPIIDQAHNEVASKLGFHDPKVPAQRGGLSTQDLMDPEVAKAKAEARVDTAPAQTKYISKDNLGTDEYGNKKMATTNVDTKTGNAIVYYDKSLDANPKAKQIILDHEEGHILDKRLNGGNNISAELSNYTGNQSSLEKALKDFARTHQMTVPEAAAGLDRDIQSLSGGSGPANENFADAVSAYRNDPKAAFEKAPTFAKLMQYVPEDARYSDHSTTIEGLSKDSPIAGKMVDQGVKEGNAAVEKHVEAKGNVVGVNGKYFELSGESLDKYNEAKIKYDKAIERYKSMSDREFAGKQIKAEGMKFSALKRELTGDLTATEIANKVKFEAGNYLGKEVDVEVNGKTVFGTIEGKPAYGNIKVKLDDGTVISVKTDAISDSRTKAEILEGIKDRPNAKEYNPYKAVGEGPKEPPVEAPKPKTEKVVVKNDKFAGTDLDTGKTVKNRLSFNPDKINAPADVEKLFNRMEGENKSFSDARISKSNEDVKDLARMVGMTPEELMKAKPGSIANSETLTAARQLVLNKARELADELKSVNPDTAGDAELKSIRDKFIKLVSMQKSVAGLRTEAANTLRSLGIELAPDENFTIKQLVGNLKRFNLDDEGAFSREVAGEIKMTTKARIGQGILKTWYASILSGPATPIRHGLSVMTNLVTDILSKGFNPKTMNEVIPSFQAMFRSFGPAFDDFRAALAGSKPEAEAFQSTSAAHEPIFTGKFATYGKVVESVGRFMDAAATGYKRVAEEVEAASSVVNSAKMSTEVQKALADAYADSINYMGEPKGLIGRAVMAGAKSATNTASILKFILPFTKIVSNVIDRQFDYIPGTSFWRATDNALERQVDNIMTKFDLSSTADRAAITERLRAQQLGRAAMGVAISTTALTLAMNGNVSGAGPSDYNEKVELERTGWRPDSIKIGNTWIPYSYLGPLAGILSMAGNIYDKTTFDKDPDGNHSRLIEKGIIGFLQSQLHHSFLKGISDLLGAVSDPTKADNYISNFGAELIPIPKAITGTESIINGAMGNQYQYQTQSIVDKIRASLGLTGSIGDMPALVPRMNAFGEPLKSDLIYGITPSVSKADAVDSFLIANDIVISIPARNAQYTDPLTGGKRKLSNDEYEAYLKESGQQIYENLQQMIPELSGADVDSQRAEIRAMLDQVRTSSRQGVMNSIE